MQENLSAELCVPAKSDKKISASLPFLGTCSGGVWNTLPQEPFHVLSSMRERERETKRKNICFVVFPCLYYFFSLFTDNEIFGRNRSEGNSIFRIVKVKKKEREWMYERETAKVDASIRVDVCSNVKAKWNQCLLIDQLIFSKIDNCKKKRRASGGIFVAHACVVMSVCVCVCVSCECCERLHSCTSCVGNILRKISLDIYI